MVRILIVEDEPPISNLLRLSLSKAGYVCICAPDGAYAADLIERERFDLVLLDIMLPEIDGYALMDFIAPKDIPVIFITAKGALDERVRGLKAGAEDYIVKPFEIAELLARVDVVLRRCKRSDAVTTIGDLEIDTCAMRVRKGGEEVGLTKKEFDLAVLFSQNRGRALSRETIYERVWGEPYRYGSKTVDLHVQRLRKKVGWEDDLRAVNKVGYRLEA